MSKNTGMVATRKSMPDYLRRLTSIPGFISNQKLWLFNGVEIDNEEHTVRFLYDDFIVAKVTWTTDGLLCGVERDYLLVNDWKEGDVKR